jgi:hypothetical protein
MECRDAQFYLRLRRHAADELGPDVTAPLVDHLAGCPACAADARAADALDRAFAAAMTAVPVPGGLRERLLAQAAQVSHTHDADPDAPAYTPFDRAVATAMKAVPVPDGLRDRLVSRIAAWQGAALRARVYRVAGALTAAALLIGLGFGLFKNTRPRLDTDALVALNGEVYGSPEESTQKWLVAQKLPERLPLPFDYNLLVFRGHEKVHGHDVPVLVFRSRLGDARFSKSGFAKVYLFRHDGRLDMQNVQADAVNSFARAEVLVQREKRGDITYVIVHTGGPEDGLQKHFLRQDGGGDPA